MAYFRMDQTIARIVQSVQSVRSVRVIFFLVMIFSATAVLRAQAGRGGINGTITDPSGAVVSSAKVTLVNRANGLTQHTLTTAAGLYTFVSLSPGQYRVTASKNGFESVAQDGVSITVDQVSVVNVGAAGWLRVGCGDRYRDERPGRDQQLNRRTVDYG